MRKVFYIVTLLMGMSAMPDAYAQMTFEQALDQFPEYSLPLDPQSITKPDNTLPIADFNNLFTNFVIDYPYILLDDGEQAHADLEGQIEDEVFEYSPGKYDTTKVHPLGRVTLHPDYYSLLFCVSNMEYDFIYIYNFDSAGVIHSGLALTVKSNQSPTYDGAFEEYSFIQSDGTILTKSLGEVEMTSMTFKVRNDGVFEMLTYQSVETSAANEWGTDERLNDLNQFALDGVPTLSGN